MEYLIKVTRKNSGAPEKEAANFWRLPVSPFCGKELSRRGLEVDRNGFSLAINHGRAQRPKRAQPKNEDKEQN